VNDIKDYARLLVGINVLFLLSFDNNGWLEKYH